jgi:hypothetical protein
VEKVGKGNNVFCTHGNVFKVYERGIKVIISRIMRLAGNIVRMGERKDAYRGLVGKNGGKGTLGKPRRRWDDNI